MSEVEQIEKRIEGLSRDDLANFREWFLDFDAAVWDRQIEADSEAGKLDSLITEATADHAAGKVRDL
jgi:hypothetical protein